MGTYISKFNYSIWELSYRKKYILNLFQVSLKLFSRHPIDTVSCYWIAGQDDVLNNVAIFGFTWPHGADLLFLPTGIITDPQGAALPTQTTQTRMRSFSSLPQGQKISSSQSFTGTEIFVNLEAQTFHSWIPKLILHRLEANKNINIGSR